MNEIQLNKLKQFFTQEIYNKLNNIVIFQDSDGSYELFNKYYVRATDNGFKVSFKYSSQEKLFSSLKHAVTYCTFDNKNKYIQANRIEFLDIMLAGLDVKIDVHRNLLNRKKDLDDKAIYFSKLNDEKERRKRLQHEVETLVNESKYLQARAFSGKR